ncbi:hypothetical protein ACQKNX_08230 [Lysinibacillus sp. NPDC093712]|uniref:hypothetical protein n=1 Tax=Lysinibacillus sp. NPDC093712 TaxID=3390579 RepID=UPI003D06FEBD
MSNLVHFDRVLIMDNDTFDIDTKGIYTEEDNKLIVNIHKNEATTHDKFAEYHNNKNVEFIDVAFEVGNEWKTFKKVKVDSGVAGSGWMVVLGLNN